MSQCMFWECQEMTAIFQKKGENNVDIKWFPKNLYRQDECGV
jgi:hypothetical protein